MPVGGRELRSNCHLLVVSPLSMLLLVIWRAPGPPLSLRALSAHRRRCRPAYGSTTGAPAGSTPARVRASPITVARTRLAARPAAGWPRSSPRSGRPSRWRRPGAARSWRQSMTRPGVTMKSTGTSWPASGIVPAGQTWSSCTVVTQTVCGPIRPAAEASANSRSANPPPLPSRAPSSPAATAAHHHQVDRGQIGQRDAAGGSGRAADRGRLARRLAQVGGIEGEERLGFGQPGDGHVYGLAILKRALAHRPLGRVRVGFHGAGRLPGRQGAQAFGGGLGPGEVRDAPGGAGEPGHLRRAHRGPHLLPQCRLRGQQVSRAASVAVVPGRGTGHAAHLAASRRHGPGGRPAWRFARPGRLATVRRAARPAGSRPSA